MKNLDVRVEHPNLTMIIKKFQNVGFFGQEKENSFYRNPHFSHVELELRKNLLNFRKVPLFAPL